jgi:hypothetical protein
MLGKIEIGINVETGDLVYLSLDHLIGERMLIQANSGGGKSYALRDIAEQSYGKIQQIILSPKNEYRTLREKFDYILVGKKNENYDIDIDIDPRHAGKLAEKILETGVNAIIDLSQLPNDRIKFMKNFIDALNNAAESLWHPVEIFIDEIHIFAPEKGYGEAESIHAITELASTGRDKGYALIGATQRLSKFNNNVASELNIKFIGKCTLDTDMARAGKEIGFKSNDLIKFRNLGNPNYYFYAFGPGVSDEVIKIKFKKSETTHVAGWQRVKNKVNPATPNKIKSLLTQFQDLPKIAEEEIKTKEQLQKKVIDLIKEINALQKDKNPIDKDFLESQKRSAYIKGYEEAEKYYKSELERLQQLHNKLLTSSEDIINQRNALSAIIKDITTFTSDFVTKLKDTKKKYPQIREIQIENFHFKAKEKPSMEKTAVNQVKENHVKPTSNSIVVAPGDVNLTGPEKRILLALAQYPDQKASHSQTALLSGYSPNGSAFTNPRAHLRSLGYIQYEQEMISITESGLKALGSYETIEKDNESLQELWLSKVTGPEKRILTPLLKKFPHEISKEDLATESGYSPIGSAFTNPLSHLRSLGLIEYPQTGFVKASKELFPQEIFN